ncbi:MAG: NAD-dependent epimerase/dehydratase family protein [Candidatus Omnitrophica bacterium]|nr:NAD-dependent epimerase/dehydratase family protein [Candidatus Omnitrophota bacterium]
MNIAVIGVSGFIGKFMVKALASNGHAVSGLDRESYPGSGLTRFRQGDLLDRDTVGDVLSGCDMVIHLAAAHHDFGVSRDEFFRVNLEGTRTILERAEAEGIKKIIFYSTVAVYGNATVPVDEKVSPFPVSPYGESKLAAEAAVERWVLQDPSRSAVIIRPAVVFGPENYANMYNLINSIAKKQFIFVGPGKNIKSIAYVENLVDATVFAMNRIGPGLNVYNYSDYPQMTTIDIVKTILTHLGYPPLRCRLPLEPTMCFAGIFDILGKITGINFPITAYRIKKFNTPTHFKSEKIRQDGFVPNIELREGLKRMVTWYVNRNRDKKNDQ